jgi:hypothetical protein
MPLVSRPAPTQSAGPIRKDCSNAIALNPERHPRLQVSMAPVLRAGRRRVIDLIVLHPRRHPSARELQISFGAGARRTAPHRTNASRKWPTVIEAESTRRDRPPLARPATRGVVPPRRRWRSRSRVLAGHASITTTQRYMNARASSLAESMRQARNRRVTRLDHSDEASVQIV